MDKEALQAMPISERFLNRLEKSVNGLRNETEGFRNEKENKKAKRYGFTFGGKPPEVKPYLLVLS